MTSIVDVIMGYKPLAYFPLLSTESARDAVTGEAGTGYNLGGTRAGPLGDTVIEWNDTDTRIEIPNFSDRCSGYDGLTTFCYIDVDAAEPGARTMYFIKDETADRWLMYQRVNGSGTLIYSMFRAIQTDSIKSRTRTFTAGDWCLIKADFSCGINALNLRTDIASYTTTAFSSSVDATDWDTGFTLYLGDISGLTEPMENGFSHFAVFPRSLGKVDYDNIAAADSSGVWCSLELGGTGQEIALGSPPVNVTSSETGWEYSLHKAVPDSLVYGQGVNFDITSGVPDRLFFVPAIGDYMLTLHDPVSGHSHSEIVGAVAA